MFDLNAIISSIGVLGVIAIVFAESGVLVGLFLPGDSLLVVAGLLSAAGHLNIWFLIFGTIAAAIVGDSVGYATGKSFGPRVFKKEESLFFKKEYIQRTESFFVRHGSWAIVFARFVPIVRTITPIMAGVGKMHYRTFLKYNIVGGVVWAGGLTTLSYLAGTYIPGIRDYVEYIVIGIVVLSLIPLVIHGTRKK